ncbi:MAG: SOS response-associated peptidase [Pseudomonadota bacterium]
MPGRFFLTRPMGEVAAQMGLPIGTVGNQPPRRNVAPGQEIVVGTAAGLRMMRWGMIPVGRTNARGRPVMETIINARSETVFDKSAFEGVRRCVVPADGWYEWTGEKRRKTAWRIRPKSGAILIFAGILDIWKAPGGLEVPQVATVTCPPNADVRDIHHRMGVILRAQDVPTWLGGDDAAAAKLMVPAPDGTFVVEPADDVDWAGA